MEVILLKDVKNVGKKDQIVVVNDGYANNYLIPNRLAVPSSKRGQQILANQKEVERQNFEKNKKEAEDIAVLLNNIQLNFKAKIGKDGKLFGGISLKQVADALEKENNIVIDKRKFIDKGPLTSLGYYQLKIELFKGVIGSVKVHVEEDK